MPADPLTVEGSAPDLKASVPDSLVTPDSFLGEPDGTIAPDSTERIDNPSLRGKNFDPSAPD